MVALDTISPRTEQADTKRAPVSHNFTRMRCKQATAPRLGKQYRLHSLFSTTGNAVAIVGSSADAQAGFPRMAHCAPDKQQHASA